MEYGSFGFLAGVGFTLWACFIHYGFQIKVLEARLALRDFVDDEDYLEEIEANYSFGDLTVKNRKSIVEKILKRSGVI